MQKAEGRSENRRASAFCILPSAFCLHLILLTLALPLSAQRSRAVRSTPFDTPQSFLRHRAIALDDSARLLRLTQNARVVAFGDVTHGTHETYAARLRVIPELVDGGG